MEIKSKVFKIGNSYAMLIPKALIDCKILEDKKEYKIKVENLENGAGGEI